MAAGNSGGSTYRVDFAAHVLDAGAGGLLKRSAAPATGRGPNAEADRRLGGGRSCPKVCPWGADANASPVAPLAALLTHAVCE
eukprot:SAG22_NODE_53_length_24242_cov_158.884231_16_plen_83_part_00